jgi:hypothetical protein
MLSPKAKKNTLDKNSRSVTKRPQKATDPNGAEDSEFPHYQAIHDHAKARGLDYVCERTAEFEERLRTLSLKQFQVLAVHSAQGMRRVILFSKR